MTATHEYDGLHMYVWRVCWESEWLTLCECQVALVCEWGVNQFGGVALVLVCVVKLSVHHAQYGSTCRPHTKHLNTCMNVTLLDTQSVHATADVL